MQIWMRVKGSNNHDIRIRRKKEEEEEEDATPHHNIGGDMQLLRDNLLGLSKTEPTTQETEQNRRNRTHKTETERKPLGWETHMRFNLSLSPVFKLEDLCLANRRLQSSLFLSHIGVFTLHHRRRTQGQLSVSHCTWRTLPPGAPQQQAIYTAATGYLSSMVVIRLFAEVRLMMELVTMQASINRMCSSTDEKKKRMAMSMKEKYDKYWEVAKHISETTLATIVPIEMVRHESPRTTLTIRTLFPQPLHLSGIINLVELQHTQLHLLVLMLDLLRFRVGLLLALLGTTTKTENQVES
ncbi:hypothetical protein LXL04_025837 [Taraxacum kok-saghyz]